MIIQKVFWDYLRTSHIHSNLVDQNRFLSIRKNYVYEKCTIIRFKPRHRQKKLVFILLLYILYPRKGVYNTMREISFCHQMLCCSHSDNNISLANKEWFYCNSIKHFVLNCSFVTLKHEEYYFIYNSDVEITCK